jgi:hypothetical protein
VHSAEELTSDSFDIRVDGRPARLVDIFPDFGEHDRLGVLVREPCGAVGASALILATITAFYDFYRERDEDFFIYPDYFLFHVAGEHGDHNMLDIWPRHKEPVVPDNAEEILRAINDRGITRLIVQEGEPGDAAVERESTASARHRIATTLAYSPRGRVDNADVAITGNDVTESYVEAVFEQSASVDVHVRGAIRASRVTLRDGGRPVETYRRVSLDEALALLAAERTAIAASRHA